MRADTSPLGARIIVALVLLLALVWFGGLDHRKLIKPDEGRYAEIPREMVVTGDWLTPRLNGLKYFEKPPLQYWATAITYETFGVSEWTSRLWTALTGFLGIVVAGATAARLYDPRTGLYAASVLASSLAFVLLAHFNTLDMGLSLFMEATLCAALLARDAFARPPRDGPDDTQLRQRAARRWMLAAWAAMALAVLSKGLVGIVLPGAALVLYLAATRDWALLRLLNPLRGMALFLLIAAPWFVAVSLANPEFPHFFFIHEHVERFLTTEHRREGPLWYFVPVLVVGLLPWIGVAASGLARAWNAKSAHGYRNFKPDRLLFIWAVLIFVFFSLSGSKLPSYILPMFPALAILAGRELARISQRALFGHMLAGVVIALAGCIAALLLHRFIDSSGSAEAIAAFRQSTIASMAQWLIGGIVAAWLAWRARMTAAIVTAGLAATIAWSILLLGHEALGRGMSTYDIAARMKPFIAPDTTIYSVGLFEHTLNFYLKKNVTLVAFRDELDFGLQQQPQKGIATLELFAASWKSDRAPLAIMAPDVFATLSAMHLPMRVVADDGRRIVIARPAAP